MTIDVIVIGAGLSGLRAATKLDEEGFSCLVLEAMDRVGGKTLSKVPESGKGVVDLGAAWINDTNQTEMFALAKKFGFDLIEQRVTGAAAFEQADGSVHTFPYDENSMELVLAGFGQAVVELADEIDIESPSKGRKAQELDSITVKDWLVKTFPDDLMVHGAGSSICASLLGAESDEMSMLYLVDYIKSGTGPANMFSDKKHGGQYLRNRQGNQSFCKRMAELLPPGSIHLSDPVQRISAQLGSQGCIVTTKSGAIYQCKKVIVSVPTTLYPSIEFQPPLPLQKIELSQNTSLGYYSKTVLIFSSPWWHDVGFSGSFTSEVGPICFARDTCSPEDGQYSITCFLVGDRGRHWSKFSKAERERMVREQFRKIFRTTYAEAYQEPIEAIQIEWTKDPWARGAPNPVMLPGVMTSPSGSSMRQSVGNIHFCGTEMALVWKGYMEGAIRSGLTVAGEVSTALASQPQL